MDRSVLKRKSVPELRDIASALQLTGTGKLRKAELIDAIVDGGGQGTPDSDETETGDAGQLNGGRDDVPDDQGSTGSDARSTSEETTDAASQTSSEESDSESGSRRRRTRTRESGRRGGSEENGSDESSSREKDDRDRGEDAQDDSGSRGRNDRRGRNDDRQDGRSNDGRGSKNRDKKGADDGGRNRGRGGKGSQGKSDDDPGEVRAGVLDILPEGYGFLRTTGYLPGERDVYVSQGQIRKQRLRRGDVVQGPIRQQRSNEKVPALHHVEKVNLEELDGNQVADRPEFAEIELAPVSSRIHLGSSESPTVRQLDLVVPQADGQRTVVTVPAGIDSAAVATDLAAALGAARPESHLMLVSIDTRPEVVRAASEAIGGEVIASTFDQAAEDHTQIAELAIERAKRLVELGHDVIVVLDSITRLARAYGVASGTGGRTVAPDIEAAALYAPKKLFAAARATDDHGSLTIIGTVLTDTGSVYDEVVAQEFTRVATGVVGLVPSDSGDGTAAAVSIHDSWIYDAVQVRDDEESTGVAQLRQQLAHVGSEDATMAVMDRVLRTDSNAELLADIASTPLAVSAGAGT